MTGGDPFEGILPGSPLAIDAGCRCPVIDNHYGQGIPDGEGRTKFVMVESCPIHGPGIKRRNPAGVRALDEALGKNRND